MATPAGRLLFVVTEDWAFLRHRLPMARAAQDVGLEVAVAVQAGRHAEAIRALGFTLFDAPVRRAGISPVRDLAYLTRLICAVRRFRPDIIHNVAAKPVLYGTLAARLARRSATVINAFTGMGILFTGDGGGRRSLKSRLVGGLLLTLLRALCRGRKVRMLVQNADDRDFLAREAIGAAARTALIPGSGVDGEAFHPLPEPAQGPVTATLVGRLLWTKGVGDFIAAARLLKDRRDIRLVLVGTPDPGNPTSVSENELRMWAAEGLIEWWGERADIPGVWAQSHIAVLPSWREGLPKSLLEAAACGRPLVATDVPGCRELVRPGHNGILVPRGDAAALARALETLADDVDRRRAYGAAARRDIEERFSAARVAEQVAAMYRDILDGAS